MIQERNQSGDVMEVQFLWHLDPTQGWIGATCDPRVTRFPGDAAFLLFQKLQL
jgi:hypothetical protein